MTIDINLVLQDLRAKRDAIDAVIANLSKLYGETETEAQRGEMKQVPPETKTLRPGPKRKVTETEKSLSAPGHKPCKKCGAMKKLDEFPTNSGCADGHTHECRSCAGDRRRREYQARQARKGKSAGGNGSGKLVYECHACHAKFVTQLAKANHNCVRAAAAGDF